MKNILEAKIYKMHLMKNFKKKSLHLGLIVKFGPWDFNSVQVIKHFFFLKSNKMFFFITPQ
jgi:hypothetical protein